jgi:Icc-related predicted phosphoesterase
MSTVIRSIGQSQGDTIHTFGQKRPSAGGQFPITRHSGLSQEERDSHYRDLPPPTGAVPYQLDLKSVIAAEAYQAILDAGKLTFHINGDMGGIQDAVPQKLVATGMEQDFDEHVGPADNPAFLYITGDCVYFNGEIEQYYAQFYEPYEFYNAPIFAVPGNHDGENLTTGDSLDGFVRNFCAPAPVKMPESMDSHRTAMTQPNVYWTLLTPLVNIIGLYSNVPAGGDIRSPQTEWLVDQLKTLPRDVPLFVALHHPIYSADDHHSGSTRMKAILEQAAAESGRHPDMILAGHVHNYQRLTKTMDDGQYPYLVVGAGGYHNLHHIMKVDGDKMVAPVTFSDHGIDVTLERFSDTDHGFLRMEVTADKITGRYYAVPKPADPPNLESRLVDYFEYDWRNRRYLPNHL